MEPIRYAWRGWVPDTRWHLQNWLLKLHKTEVKLGREVHSDHPSTWEADAGRLQVSGWLELHSKTLFKKREGNKAIYWWLFLSHSRITIPKEGATVCFLSYSPFLVVLEMCSHIWWHDYFVCGTQRPTSAIQLGLETGFLNNAELTLNRLGWPVSSRNPSVSTSPELGL